MSTEPVKKIHFIKINKLQLTSALEDEKPQIYIQTKWSEERVDLLLHDTKSTKCFKGKVTTAQMQTIATELELEYTEFYDECYNALAAPVPHLIGYDYEIDESGQAFRLIRKADFDIVILEFEIKETNESFHEMLENALNLIETAQTAKAANDGQKDKYNDNLKKSLELLENLKAEKQNMESKMLRRFNLLLNAKKRKIQELQQKLQQTTGVTIVANDIDDDIIDYDTDDDDDDDYDGDLSHSNVERTATKRKSLETTQSKKKKQIVEAENDEPNDNEDDSDDDKIVLDKRAVVNDDNNDDGDDTDTTIEGL